jgi:hypothetical protein
MSISTYIPPSVFGPSLVGVTGGTISVNSGFGTLGSVPLPTHSIHSHFDGLMTTNKHVKKFTAVEIDDDLLALSVAFQRVLVTKLIIRYKSLLDDRLFAEVTVADREKAQVIREYYGKKVLKWTLKGVKLTKWRHDMSAFVNSDGYKFAEDVLGLVYMLPHFYAYDCQLDEFKQSLPLYTLPESSINSVGVKTLTPAVRIHKKNKRIGHVVEYWFTDQNSAAVRISVERRNPLDHLWHHMFSNEQTLSIKAAFVARKQDDFEYYSAQKWELQHKEEK